MILNTQNGSTLTSHTYHATNRKDEFPQMTLWLEWKEKVQRHEAYITWVLAGHPSPKSVTFANAVPRQPVSTGAPESHFHIFKTPSVKAVLFSLLVTDYGATYFRDVLARYIVTCRNPALSGSEVERQSAKIYFRFSSVQVFHKIRFTVKDLSSSVGSSSMDVAHVKPASKDKWSKTVPGRFDTVLVRNVESSTLIGAHSKFQIFSSSKSKWY